jgi:thiol-disulfide isomerase/thioredoxin
MRKIYTLLAFAILLGCRESSVNSNVNDDLLASVAKTEEQAKLVNKNKKDRMQIAQIGNTSPIGTLLNQDSVIISTKNFNGKLLVIDFWATWCSPCIDEAPKFKELEKKYENERIEFITVSVDDEFNYWKDYIVENNWKTDNYWFGMKETDPFFAFMYSEMEIRGAKKTLIGLPKYVILSPAGEILNNQSSKPSDPKFEEEIILMIEKHAS